MTKTSSDITESPLNGGTSSNPFEDIAALVLPQTFDQVVGQKILTTIAVRRPKRIEWIRVNPDFPQFEIGLLEYELNGTTDVYFVHPTVYLSGLSDVATRAILQLAINTQGSLFLWPLKVPVGGAGASWHESAIKAATLARTAWVRIAANRNAGAYDTFLATGEIPPPTWPEKSYSDILQLAFDQKIIDDTKHPVFRAIMEGA